MRMEVTVLEELFCSCRVHSMRWPGWKKGCLRAAEENWKRDPELNLPASDLWASTGKELEAGRFITRKCARCSCCFLVPLSSMRKITQKSTNTRESGQLSDIGTSHWLGCSENGVLSVPGGSGPSLLLGWYTVTEGLLISDPIAAPLFPAFCVNGAVISPLSLAVIFATGCGCWWCP